MRNSKYFYCYSCKLMHFLKSYGFWYLSKGLNRKNNSIYYLFEKSDDLDNAIIVWNSIKFKLKERNIDNGLKK